MRSSVVSEGELSLSRHRNASNLASRPKAYPTRSMSLEPFVGSVKLTILHESGKENAKFIEAVSGGWPRIVSNLKSLL